MTDQASPPTSPEEPPPSAPEAPDPALGEAPKPPVTSVMMGETPKPPAQPAASPQPEWRPSYAFLAIVAVITLVADLGTKWWAKVRLEDAKTWDLRHIDVIKGFFSFRFARNLGGAWGLLQDEPESIRRPFFLGISVLAIIFIVSLFRKLTPQQTALKWGLPLVLGGALGNLVNRIQYNYVVDFIDFQYKGHHWPTFNVADIAIVAGVGLMAIDMFTPRRDTEKKAPPIAATDAAREPAPPSDAAPPAAPPAPKET